MNVASNMAVFNSRRDIFGVQVCDLDWSEAFALVGILADLPSGQTVVSFLDAHKSNLIAADPAYREVLSRHLVLPEGTGVNFASLALHQRIFPADLNGNAFVPALLTYMATSKRVGLVGARADVLKRAKDAFVEHAPWHEFIAIHGGSFDDEGSVELAEEISRHKLDLLLVAMDTPKQEMWIDRYIRPEQARLVLGVNGLFDMMAGDIEPQSSKANSFRFDWLRGLHAAPGQALSRYFLGGAMFVARVLTSAIVDRLFGGGRSYRGRPAGVRES